MSITYFLYCLIFDALSFLFRRKKLQSNVILSSCLLGTRFSEGDGSSNEVQRTMLELINQLDGFDPRGNIKVLMATNR